MSELHPNPLLTCPHIGTNVHYPSPIPSSPGVFPVSLTVGVGGRLQFAGLVKSRFDGAFCFPCCDVRDRAKSLYRTRVTP